MDYMSRTMMQRGERRVLVLLDEFQNLGKLENALTVATVLGGYGIPCWFFVQSLRSIDNVYTREGRQTLVNSARAQIFLGAQDPEDQRYVSQLLGDRREVTVDKAVSTGVTLFDHKGSTKSHRTTMRPLMRPDELGSMDETRCIIKLRNQQPIFGVRNFYYADKLLAKRAWMTLPRSLPNAVTASEGASDKFDLIRPDKTFPANDLGVANAPGMRFKSRQPRLPTAMFKSIEDNSEQFRPRALYNCETMGKHSHLKPPPQAAHLSRKDIAPDFAAMLARSGARRAEAEQSVAKALLAFDANSIAAAATKDVHNNVAAAFADE
jgi:hypothetical protein